MGQNKELRLLDGVRWQPCGGVSPGSMADHRASPVQVIYLVRDVWRGLSAKGDGYVLPGGDKGFQRSLKDLTLTR